MLCINTYLVPLSDHEHTHPVLRNFQSWVSDKFSSESLEDPQATKSFLKIVFARLNTLRSEIPCGRHGGGANARSDNSNHLDRVKTWYLIRLLVA
ncbi:hypothetical protein DPMN_191029 [Dreissena polymorpha]|uniref:Uncharacterized protein n=1 Tax=Dreissena polymorpha TaxID=45954 RepID=A0A9D3Y2N5_DREPO|nr:hypothetical protein DPMN_191029 [Dreissena polymorpha]